MYGRDLLSICELQPDELSMLLQTAMSMKHDGTRPVLAGKTVAMLFEKPSLRTRVSFEVGMKQLGGDAIYLSQSEVGLGQREPVKDVARVLSRYVAGIVARTYAQQTLYELAEAADVPVVNALSDDEHPCQALADLLTVKEHKGHLDGIRIAFIGDGNNVAASLAVACGLAGAEFVIASPEGYQLPDGMVAEARSWAGKTGGAIETVIAPEDAARNADVVYTDVWTSMGQEASYRERLEIFRAYHVDAQLMSLAKAGRHLHARPARPPR